jgi:hypothetical protein
MPATAGGIDVGEWLRSREPAPPPALAERLSVIVGEKRCGNLGEVSASLLETAEDLLAKLSDGRESAFDLLLADALITYAMEAAADDCASLDAVAASAMKSISAHEIGGKRA